MNLPSVSGEFLTQEEVDALLKGVNLEEGAPSTPAPDAVRTLNLATQERIVRDRVPALAIINDRFARLLRAALSAFLHRDAVVSVDGIRTTKYGDFLHGLTGPASVNVTQAQPVGGHTLFVFDAALVSLVVDQMFGGDGRFGGASEVREFTATEQRIIARLLERVTGDYRNAWRNTYPLEFVFVRSEQQAQSGSVAATSEVMVVSSFTIQLGNSKGTLHICIPCATLEPIRELSDGDAPAESMPPDRRWAQSLASHVQSAEVEVVASLATSRVTLRELMGLQVGSIVPIEVAREVRAEVDGVPLLECQYGVLNGHYALRVNRVLKSNSIAGGEHA